MFLWPNKSFKLTKNPIILWFVFLCVDMWNKYFAFPEIMFTRVFSLKCTLHIFNLKESGFAIWSVSFVQSKVVMKIILPMFYKHCVKKINFLMFYRSYNFRSVISYLFAGGNYRLNHMYITYSMQILNNFMLIKYFIIFQCYCEFSHMWQHHPFSFCPNPKMYTSLLCKKEVFSFLHFN